jgi:hypothetical protein
VKNTSKASSENPENICSSEKSNVEEIGFLTRSSEGFGYLAGYDIVTMSQTNWEADKM